MTELNNVAYANITVLQNFTNGPVAFNITAYDGSGNEFNVTQNDTSANVIIDTVDPKSSNLTIYSNNSRTDYAMAGHLLPEHYNHSHVCTSCCTHLLSS